MIKGQTKPASNCKTVSWRTLLPEVFSFQKQHWPLVPNLCRAPLLPWEQAVLLHSTPEALHQGKVMGWQGSTQHSKTNCTSWFSPSRRGEYPPNRFIPHCSCMESSDLYWLQGRELVASLHSPQVWAGTPERVKFVKSDSLISHLLK